MTEIYLDDFHAHEALDRTGLICDMFENYVAEHPYIKNDKALMALCEEASHAIYAVYNAIGTKCL